MKIIKYIKAILLFKQVAHTYKAETGKDKPAFLSRTVIGSAITALAGVSALAWGVDVSGDMQAQILTHIGNVADSAYVILGEVKKMSIDLIALYGIALLLMGRFKKDRQERRKNDKK